MLGRIRRLSCRLLRARRGDPTRSRLRACTNDIRVRLLGVRRVLVCSVSCHVRFVGVPCFYPATAPQGSGLLSVCCGLCFMSGSSLCRFICGMSSVSVMQDRLQKGLPSVAITGLPIQFLYSLRFDALSIAFRVAGFVRADLTKFPWMSPVTCEGETTVILADCKGIYLLPDFQSKYPHSAVRANASHTVRLMGSPL
jgi:hypothetical protein